MPERFGATIDAIQEQTGIRAVLLGGPDEVELCGRVAETCSQSPSNLAGRTTIRQLAAIIKQAEVILCHDSAAMHLAVALERPLVCLVGPTNPLRTGPYRRIADVVQVKLDCSPCYLRRLSQCRWGHRCMRDLEVPVVADAILRAIAAPAAVRS
jgi:ADP-heptose:LPS heptosyltransferase